MTYVVYTDGGSRNNPGEAAIGAVIMKDGEIVHEISERIGIATNNVAEYVALVHALEYLVAHNNAQEPAQIRLDSKLVVEQVLGHWKVKEMTLKPYVVQAQSLLQQLSTVSLEHVPREQNTHADMLVNRALDAR